MKEKGIEKITGQTWIEINGKIYTFMVDEKSHEQSNKIKNEMKTLYNEMEKSGQITNYLNKDDEEGHLCSHTEKLAIGYGLTETPPGTPLLISKDQPICPDCHGATSIISQFCKRDITIRDTSCFHHFKNGKCSCNNYW